MPISYIEREVFMKNRRLLTRIECEMRRRADDKPLDSLILEHKRGIGAIDLMRVRSIVQADYIQELEHELVILKLRGRYAK